MDKDNGFDNFYAEIESEAQAEGPEAIQDLRAKELKYALINSLMVARRRLQLTQEQLAKRSGIAQTEISRIERGRKSPTVDTYTKLAAALGVSIPLGQPQRPGRSVGGGQTAQGRWRPRSSRA